MIAKSKSPGQKRFRSLWDLGGLSPWFLARNVVREIRSNNFLGRASELAFDFLFALFPLILFMVTMFGLFASRSVELQDDFLSFFADFLPPLAFQLLRKTTVELAAAASDGMLTFAIVTALWFASGGVNSMISALNLAYRVKESRGWLKVRLIAFGLTLSISILLLAALLTVLVSSHFVDWVAMKLRDTIRYMATLWATGRRICSWRRPTRVLLPKQTRARVAKRIRGTDTRWFRENRNALRNYEIKSEPNISGRDIIHVAPDSSGCPGFRCSGPG
jgi:hypothetical protein